MSMVILPFKNLDDIHVIAEGDDLSSGQSGSGSESDEIPGMLGQVGIANFKRISI